MKSILLSLMFFGSLSSYSAVNLSTIEGSDLLAKAIHPKDSIQISIDDKRALVVVFLSAKCPCSDSHVAELKLLSKDYPDVRFVGVNSNIDETPELSKAYFEKAGFDFPILKDKNALLADRYSALKTPHAFVIGSDGIVLYQGGVSSSKRFETAERKYLREALVNIQKGEPVKTPEGRTLGCAITREVSHVW